MTSLTIHIDGYPYQIEFSGAVDIERLESGNVAVRLASDGARVKVTLDEEEHERLRKLIETIAERAGMYMVEFRGFTENIGHRELQKAYDDAWRGR